MLIVLQMLHIALSIIMISNVDQYSTVHHSTILYNVLTYNTLIQYTLHHCYDIKLSIYPLLELLTQIIGYTDYRLHRLSNLIFTLILTSDNLCYDKLQFCCYLYMILLDLLLFV